MEAQITDKQEWLCIDGEEGTEYIQGDLLPMNAIRAIIDGDGDGGYANRVLALVRDYARCDVALEAEIVFGYGVRSSADGYMDCTDWEVYTTKKEAMQAYRREQRECGGLD